MIDRREMNRRAVEEKKLTHLRRTGMLLDLAAVDPEVEVDGGKVECFFCGGTSSDFDFAVHTHECVWARATREAPAIRATIAHMAESTTHPAIAEAARAVLAGTLLSRKERA